MIFLVVVLVEVHGIVMLVVHGSDGGSADSWHWCVLVVVIVLGGGCLW